MTAAEKRENVLYEPAITASLIQDGGLALSLRHDLV